MLLRPSVDAIGLAVYLLIMGGVGVPHTSQVRTARTPETLREGAPTGTCFCTINAGSATAREEQVAPVLNTDYEAVSARTGID